jgi:3-oxoadipate enol-lactonase
MPSTGGFRYLEALPGGKDRPRGTLVLIHAFPLNARLWEPQLALADQGWRVLAPQLGGVDGGHEQPPTTSIDDYAGGVFDLLDRLHVHEAVIGGLSMGGYVTMAMFRHAPRYFLGMVLADTRPQADTPEGLDGRTRMLQLLRDKGPSAIADEMLPKLLGDTTRRDRPEVGERVRSLILSNSSDSIAGAIVALRSRSDSTRLLETVRCPTLILVGEEDALTPPDLSRGMHRAVPGSELVVVPGAGHLASLEQPAAFNAAVASFLERRV